METTITRKMRFGYASTCTPTQTDHGLVVFSPTREGMTGTLRAIERTIAHDRRLYGTACWAMSLFRRGRRITEFLDWAYIGPPAPTTRCAADEPALRRWQDQYALSGHWGLRWRPVESIPNLIALLRDEGVLEVRLENREDE